MFFTTLDTGTTPPAGTLTFVSGTQTLEPTITALITEGTESTIGYGSTSNGLTGTAGTVVFTSELLVTVATGDVLPTGTQHTGTEPTGTFAQQTPVATAGGLTVVVGTTDKVGTGTFAPQTSLATAGGSTVVVGTTEKAGTGTFAPHASLATAGGSTLVLGTTDQVGTGCGNN